MSLLDIVDRKEVKLAANLMSACLSALPRAT